MFNLLIKAGGWNLTSDSLPKDRVFEHTADELKARFKPADVLAIDTLAALPVFLVPEVGNPETPFGVTGKVTRFRASTNSVAFDFAIDSQFDPVPIAEIQQLSAALDIDRFELNRTHWAVKDVDLFQVLSPRSALDPASELVGADTIQRWRERALNLVEELAGELAGSIDREERAAGELALAAVAGLRPYLQDEIPPDRRAAWGRLLTAIVAFVPKGKEGLELVQATIGVARLYKISVW